MTDEKVERLRRALEAYTPGEHPILDPLAEEERAKVRARALTLLDHRARSRHELRSRLVEAEFPPEVVDAVLADLADSGLIDDATFAHEWVRQRHERRGKSRRVLDRELQAKGVQASVREEALEQIDASAEERVARQLAEKKARSLHPEKVEYQKALRRVVGVLARRGFPEGMAIQLAKEALAGQGY